MTQVKDDEPALLLVECGEEKIKLVLLNKEKAVQIEKSVHGGKCEENVWYLDNGASNHMRGQRLKFKFWMRQ